MTTQPTDGQKKTATAGVIKRPESRYAEFLRNSTLGIWHCALEKPIAIDLPLEKQITLIYKYGYMAEANDMMAAMYGLKSAKDLEGARLADLLPENETQNQEYLKNFISSGYKLRDAESHELDAEGNTKFFLNSLIGIVEHGFVKGAWGTQLDVTRLHETTTALKESEARLKLALEASKVGMWEWNAVDDTLHWSDQVKQLYNVPDDFQITTEQYFRLMHPDDVPRMKRVIKNAMKTRKGFEIDHRIFWPDGSVHWLLCRGQTLYEKSKPVRLLGTCMNIDERKTADDLRERSNKLDEERRKLLELSVAKDEFIALASHQLRTPATSVKQYLGILLDGVLGDLDLTEEQMKMLRTAYDSNERQINIVNYLLLVATIDAGKLKLNTRPVNLGDLVRDIMNDSEVERGGRKYHLKIKAVDEPLVAICDSDRIRMALENVITNAFKYSPNDSLVTIEVIRREKNAVIRVTDRGVGIEKEDLPRLFQKFSRINNPLSIVSGGTGLGLYWSEKIVALHGGTIKVSSNPGKKTTFTIQLPL